MSHAATPETLPRGALIAIATLLLVTLAAVAGVRLSGVSITEPDAPAVATRLLRFDDRPDGTIAVLDAGRADVVAIVREQGGFVRGALRALARERLKRGLGPEPAFELIGRADGRLTLIDPATGSRVDLESFGPTNAAAFARLLATAPKPGAGR